MIIVWIFFTACGVWMTSLSISNYLFNQIGNELKLELTEKKLVHNGIYKEKIVSKLNDEQLKAYQRIVLFSKIRRGSMLLLIILTILIVVLEVIIE